LGIVSLFIGLFIRQILTLIDIGVMGVFKG